MTEDYKTRVAAVEEFLSAINNTPMFSELKQGQKNKLLKRFDNAFKQYYAINCELIFEIKSAEASDISKKSRIATLVNFNMILQLSGLMPYFQRQIKDERRIIENLSNSLSSFFVIVQYLICITSLEYDELVDDESQEILNNGIADLSTYLKLLTPTHNPLLNRVEEIFKTRERSMSIRQIHLIDKLKRLLG